MEVVDLTNLAFCDKMLIVAEGFNPAFLNYELGSERTGKRVTALFISGTNIFISHNYLFYYDIKD